MKKQVLQHNREQSECLTELGMRLRDLRQQQEIPLEEIAGKTRIQPRLLRAIEQGNLEELPEAVYIHSFLRQYANAIGLNGVQFASEFPTIPGLPAARRRHSSWRSLPGAQLRPMHLYLLYMVLIVAAVNGLSFLMNRSQSPVATIEPQNLQPIPAVTLGPVNPAQAGAGNTAVSSQPSAIAQKSVRIGVTTTDQSWVRIVADGKTEFEGVLPEGTQNTWTATKQVVIRAGNAGGVLVTFNEGQADVLGQPGVPAEKTFPPADQFANLPSLGAAADAASVSP
ncbi:RodZ domain-containing protein [Myxacorys almedinensis]|uniref:DUF4115 domain-containing protein n=1 Tax=Myxacorys almedinensis A TaxID=2690445 RepID=A0A8J7Z6N6_9CYAN|nr:RodZ domain-containing protein [Myxacorys almedinensis]NDJ18896.1 DUF4115 domain-containing protein [Myxacorys almedinensis A]